MKFILCSDLHLRVTVPICRKETEAQWVETQTKQLSFIAEEAHKRNCGIAMAGDIYHKPSVPDIMKNIFFSIFEGLSVGIMPGQHDLPNHNYNEIERSSFGVLWNSGKFQSMCTFGDYILYGEEEITTRKKSNILFLHDLIFENEKSIPPNVEAKLAQDVLDKYPDYDWILCGDNHHGFHYKNKGRHLIMSGCINRQAADYIDYEPCIWFIDTKENIVEKILMPDDVNMVDTSHIKNKEEKEERVSAFVTSIKENKGVSLDFEENVRNSLLSKDIEDGVKITVRELMED